MTKKTKSKAASKRATRKRQAAKQPPTSQKQPTENTDVQADVNDNSWDEWVPEDRMRPTTEDNLELAKMLKTEVQSLNRSKSHKKGAVARASDNSPVSGAPNAQIAAKKRGRDLETEKVSIHVLSESTEPC